MELRHLRYFVAVAEEGHITKAAERLGMQQPPLSQQIKALETELGFPLFKRLPRGVELTEGGRTLLHDAKAILANVELASERAARAARGMEGSVVLGFTTSAAAHRYIPDLIRAFGQAYPKVMLELKEENAAELTNMLMTGDVDAAIIRAPVMRPAGIVFHTLLQEPLLLILPAGHRLLKGGKAPPAGISLKELSGEEFILVRQSGGIGMYSDLIDACQRAGFVPRIGAEVGRMLTNISMVAGGRGVSVVPACMQGFHQDKVAYCKLCDAPGLAAPMTLLYPEAMSNLAALSLVGLAKQIASAETVRSG